ncbi:sigma-70 family RNA polymerase sigma factor [Listeria booriae]|uniref:sigma-70 family RNA polymerase sigma factor n=1 Tax=Listeria booriae TaxID=1552123 RepID=UPI0016235F1B|nr:sigma-70 family RNA polymerase sigma factor [Listeria booriae]MBC2080287.1 sigma-70 family RNA polymerase sigma factor [Listeria booriae]
MGNSNQKRDDQWKKHKQHTFDSFCKKIIRNELVDFYRELKRQRANEVSLNMIREQPIIHDISEDYTFLINGMEIVVQDNLLGEALEKLDTRKREIILLSYFLNLTDVEIAKSFGMSTRKLNRIRHRTLVELKKIIKMEEG